MRQNYQSHDKDSKVAQDLKAYRIGMKLDGAWGKLAGTQAFRNLLLSKEFLLALGSPYVSMVHLGFMTNAKTSDYTTHIRNFISSNEFSNLVRSDAMDKFVHDCEVAKLIKSLKVFKVKEDPKKSDDTDDSEVRIQSFKKHKKVLFSFLIYNLFRDSNLSNAVLQSPGFRSLYESDEADALARSRVSQDLTHLVYNGETDGLVDQLRQLLSSEEFGDLAEADEMHDFLNSSKVVDLIKSYLVSKTGAVVAQDASVSQESDEDEDEDEDQQETEEDEDEECDFSDNLHIDTTSVSSSSSSSSSDQESEEETEETDETESSILSGNWVSKTLDCKSATKSATEASESSDSTSSSSSSSTSSSAGIPSARCCNKRPLINEHGLVKKGGVMVLKATEGVSISGILSQLNQLNNSPQLQSMVQNLTDVLKQAQGSSKVASAVQSDPQAVQGLRVVSKSLKTKNVQEIKTAITNNIQRLNNVVQQALQQRQVKPAPIIGNATATPVNGKPAPIIGNAPSTPVKQQSSGFIQGLYKNSFTHVIYRYFKDNADIKAYSRFIGSDASKQQFQQWKCSDDSLAEFQQFVGWYCANYDRVVKAIRKSLSQLAEDDEEDFTGNDLYVGFKRYITFADWIHFQRFIKWAGKGGQSANDVDGFNGWARQFAHGEEYSRSDFDDWKDTFSERDFIDVVNFMRWRGSKKLYGEACQACCQ